jgi:hypothetical protein
LVSFDTDTCTPANYLCGEQTRLSTGVQNISVSPDL